MKNFALLTLSLRATERVPTLSGSRLDAIKLFDLGTESLLADKKVFTSLGVALPLDRGSLDCAKPTSIMCSALANLFDGVRILKEDIYPIVRLKREGVGGFFEIDHVLICKSSREKAGQVEGDDILFVIFLRGILRVVENQELYLLEERFKTAQDLWSFLQEIGINSDKKLEFSDYYPPGDYLLHSDRILEEATNKKQVLDWLNGSNSYNARSVTSLICAYLFYSYLLCQRTERLAMSVGVNGEWDVEWRKLILARKKLVVARQHAMLKNRAMPDSPMLPIFSGISRIYRLETQLDNLVSLLDELSKTLETQNSYETGRRVRTIETIIFFSTILGLGVGLNAIQMAPFYEAGDKINDLTRIEFWIVFAAVFCIAGTIWGFYANGKKIRRWLFTRLRIITIFIITMLAVSIPPHNTVQVPMFHVLEITYMFTKYQFLVVSITIICIAAAWKLVFWRHNTGKKIEK